MKSRSLFIFTVFGFLAVLTTQLACTKSPFDEEVAPPPTKISGRIDLHRVDDDNSNIYVWLEGINISTFTDSTGYFELELPLERSSDVTGAYRLFCFVANYTTATADIILQNGLFRYSQGDLDRFGGVNRVIDMFKILDITTIVQPRSTPITFGGPIDVQVTVRAIADSVAVVFPKSVGGLLGGLFFRNLDTGQIFIDIPDEGADTKETIIVGSEQPISRRGVFQLNGTNFRDLILPIGDYEVIPYFFIEHEELPAELLRSLGERVEEPHPQFLNIPVKRDGGKFRVF